MSESADSARLAARKGFALRTPKLIPALWHALLLGVHRDLR